MTIKSINGAMLRKMVLNGAKLLDINKQHVDSLNVFPVPDGDTGTNMSLTLISAAKELSTCPNNNISVLCDAISKGALRGARGNSGVISSQILKGISIEFAKCAEEITVKDFARALTTGTEIAYKAVTKPQEGTILTVIRTMGEQGAKFAKRNNNNIVDFLSSVIKVGEETLKQTPEMLPVLKKAGVVDAGGRGLLIIFQGFYNSLLGKEEVNLEFDDSIAKVSEGKSKNNYEQFHINLSELDAIEFAYCTEFFIIHIKETAKESDIDDFRNKLLEIGDCVLVIGDLSMVKVHVHTNNPGKALSYALELGELDRLKIENMLEQNRALIGNSHEELKPYGMVSVCSGEGMAEIFKDLTVDEIIEGGQTMNPSAEDIATACDKIAANDIFVFPNNKNIILAAEQAKELSKRNIHVVPTVNVPQGLSAALAFNPQDNVDDIVANMKEAMSTVKVGSVTFAVRTTDIDGFSLSEGDIIGLSDKSILTKGEDVNTVTEELIEKIMDDNVSTITLYYGYNTTKEQVDELTKKLIKKYDQCDVDSHNGGQALYYYIIALD